MPRPPRIDFPDAVYHITSRGNGRGDIFWNDDDRKRFLAQLAHHLHLDVQACLTEDDRPVLEAMAASRYAIGGAAFIERTEARIEERRKGRLQDRDLDLPRWTVSLDAIEAAVARHYRMDPTILSAHGHRAGPAKAVAVELAARLAGMSGRAIGLRYGIGAAAVGAIHRRLADRPEVLQVVESLTQQLRKTRTKLKV